MKLYRGLKASEFKHFTADVSAELRTTWSSILKRRALGDWSFPLALNNEINQAEKLLRLQRQYFTDQYKMALNYAKANNGALVEIDVSQKDILDHFHLEFQNFGKRKTSFEVVYVIDASLLQQHHQKWKLKSISLESLKCQ